MTSRCIARSVAKSCTLGGRKGRDIASTGVRLAQPCKGILEMRSSGPVDERTAVRCSGRDTGGNGVKPFPEGKPYCGTIAAVNKADSNRTHIRPTKPSRPLAHKLTVHTPERGKTASTGTDINLKSLEM